MRIYDNGQCNNLVIIIAGQVPARHDIWFVGDTTLKNMFKELQDMYTKSNNPPFIYQHFNIFYFFKSLLVSRRNALLRTGTAIVDAFNERILLPRIIFVILDEDILNMINQDEWGLTKQIERCIKWISTQITREIDARIEFLLKMKPGAIINADEEPTIIWLEMIEKPYQGGSFANKNRNKFNKCVNDLAIREKNTKVMSIDNLDWRHFDRHGYLTQTGKKQFWEELSNTTQDFIKGKNKLEPKYYISTALLSKPSVNVPTSLPFGMRSMPMHPTAAAAAGIPTHIFYPAVDQERPTRLEQAEDRLPQHSRRDREFERNRRHRRDRDNQDSPRQRPSRRSLFKSFSRMSPRKRN